MFDRPDAPLSDPIATLAALMAKGNDLFTVKFRKRTTGEMRVMTCKRKTDNWARFTDDMEHQVITVWDAENQGYRRIPLDGVMEISGVSSDEFILHEVHV